MFTSAFGVRFSDPCGQEHRAHSLAGRIADVRSLIIVEGLPKSGKSSVGAHIASELGIAGFGESDLPHPIDIGWPTDRRAAILRCRQETYPFEEWERLTNSLAESESSLVLEARLCQNAACFALTAGAPLGEALAISQRLISTIERVNPLVLYLRPADHEAHVRSILDHFDGPSRDYLAQVFSALPFASSRCLSGETAFVETVRAWPAVIEATMQLVAASPGCTLVTIDEPGLNWPQTHRLAVEATRQ